MCGLCESDTVADFIFPRKDEELHDWFHRVEDIEHMNLVMMHQRPANLHKIAESYKLQGFTYWNKPEVLNVLILRDLIFITYSAKFKQIMAWK